MEKDIKTKIIIIDDDKDTCETLADILKVKQFQVEIAHSGKSCLEKINAHSFDAAILDIKLPDIDGLTLLEKIQEITPDIIALFVTGHASVDYARKALSHGASGFFVKPLAIEEILHQLQESLEKRSLTRRYKETSAKLNNIIDASCDAIFSIDEEGTVLQANGAAQHIFGYRSEEFAGMGVGTFLGNGSEHASALYQFPCGSDTPKEISGRTKQGEHLDLEISSGPYLENDRKMFSLIIRNVSARKKMEQERELIQTQLTQANKMEAIGTLAGGIAHDFNNILTSILGYSQMVSETLEEGSICHQDMKQVINAGLRAKELVRQILTFSRKSKEEVQPVQPSAIIKEVVSLLHSSIPKNITIVSTIKNKEALILINPVQFHQVIMNLCVNAYHAMPKGGKIQIELASVSMTPSIQQRLPQLIEAEYLQIIISDTGLGIPPQVMARIFEPYFTTKKMEEGTGLGLSTAQGIVLTASGAIEVESCVGKGTTFTIYLPLLNEDTLIKAMLPDETLAQGKEHILLIDDEMAIVELGRRTLEKLGYRITPFYSSTEAFNFFKENKDTVDIIISDYSMPNMTGLELAENIYQIRPDLPVLLMSGYAQPFEEGQLEQTGIKTILVKPVTKKQLTDTIREILDGPKEKVPTYNI